MIAAGTRPIRVLHALHSLDTGGAERIVCDLARYRRGELITGAVCLDGLGRLTDEARNAGVEVFCTHRRSGIDIRQITRVADVIRRFRPDVIHAHQYSPYFYAAMAASVVGFGRIVFTEHGRHWPDVVSTPRRMVNQVLRLRRDCVTAVCRFAADALRTRERIVGRNVRIIPNGVRCEHGQRSRRRDWLADQLGVDADVPIFIQVARFHPVKDHETSLRAFARVIERGRRAQLVLVGDGPQRGRIEQLRQELHIETTVHLLGERDDIADLLSACDAFVLSSLSEAASLSIMEAMSAGLPVAATDVGGNREIVRHGHTGLLSGRRDVEALAASLMALAADGGLREKLGRSGQQRARTLFTQERMHDAFVDVYRQMVGGAA